MDISTAINLWPRWPATTNRCNHPTARQKSDMPDKTILIAGYWGFGNIGDEAVLSVTIEDVRKALPNARIIVTSERPELTKAMHGVETVGWRRLADYVPAIISADHIIVGGGGLWNSYFETASIDFLQDTSNYAVHIFSVPILARLLEKPVTIYCVGGGVILGDLMRKLAADSLACAGAIIARDVRTQSFFVEELGVSNCQIAADPAFRLKPAPDNDFGAMKAVLEWTIANRPIAVILRQWFGSPTADLSHRVAKLLAQASHETHRPLLFIPFDSAIHQGDALSDDHGMIMQVLDKLPPEIITMAVEIELPPSDALRLITESSCVISMRLHGCILATQAAKPLLAIEYDPKIRAVLQDVGQTEQVIRLPEIDTPRAYSIIASGLDPSSLQTARSIATQALELSTEGPRLLAHSFQHPHLPPMSSSLEQTAKSLVAAGLLSRSIMSESFSTIAGLARESVNSGNVKIAKPTLKMLQLHDPECGEWLYLEAVMHSSSGGSPEATHRMLDKAKELGFDPIWIRYVRACTFAAQGRKIDAAHERDAAKSEDCNHPAIPGFSEVC
jgi:polysaccharide pyruvyl transferase CsaB